MIHDATETLLSEPEASSRLAYQIQPDLLFEFPRRKRNSRCTILVVLVWIIVLLLLVIGSTTVIAAAIYGNELAAVLGTGLSTARGAPAYPLTPTVSPNRSCACSNSTRVAREMGCTYDTLAAAWIQPYCIDQLLTSEFDAHDWTYYADEEGNQVLTLEEVAELGNEPTKRYYTTHEWHIQHCVFYWRKLWRSLRRGTTVEPVYNTEEHIVHCGNLFLRRNGLQEITTGSGINMNVDKVPLYTLDF